MQDLKRRAANARPVPIHDHLSLMTTNILSEAVYGKSYKIEDDDYKQLSGEAKEFEQLSIFMVILTYFPKLRPILQSQITRFKNLMASSCSLFMRHYEENLRNYEPEVVRNVCDAFNNAINCENEAARRYITNQSLSMQIVELIGTGTYSTRVTANWVMLLLAHYHDCQRKLRKEVAEVIGSETVRLEHKSGCSYVQAFIAECLRFKPVTPIVLTHVATKPSWIKAKSGSYLVPKGTNICLNQYAINYDKEMWLQPEVFDPERFIDENGNLDSSKRELVAAFGFGSKSCPAKVFALNELFLTLVRIVQLTNWIKVDGEADLNGDLKIKQFNHAVKHNYVIT